MYPRPSATRLGHSLSACRPSATDLPLHRALSVFLFDADGRLLIQQRSARKLTFPLLWSNTCCSHPLANTAEACAVDGVLGAARRTLRAELGLAHVVDLMRAGRLRYAAVSSPDFGEHELDHLVMGTVSSGDAHLVLDPEEVQDTKYVHLAPLLADMQANGERYSPWFRLVTTRLLSGERWWSRFVAGDFAFVSDRIVVM